ncbi:MAG: D-alanyl-D-alanine carboxypeptidase [Clostridia bacterium]|nr:D-alanyl-D-alanine carboxypeptidase [Clostridia bacterium]
MKVKCLTLVFCLIVLFSMFLCTSTNVVKLGYADEYKCKSSILIDAGSGKVLYQENINEKLPIASIVKLMTLYLIFEALDNNQISENDLMQVSEYASTMGGSQLFLDANTSHKVSDLIKSVVIASANDSAVVLAENLAGSEENFVVKMNDKAKELEMDDTLFVDSTGLNEEGYSTASDVAILSKNVLTNKHYQKYSKIWLDSYTHPSGRDTELANTNKLLRKYENCIAGKTGTTEKAGFCYTSLSNNNGFELICVVLGSKTTSERFDIAKEMFLTGYANYKYQKLYEKDSFYKDIKINKAKEVNVKTYFKDDVGFVVGKNQNVEYNEVFEKSNIEAPLKAGTIIGTLEIVIDDEVVAKSDVIVKDDVKMMGFVDVIKKITEKW